MSLSRWSSLALALMIGASPVCAQSPNPVSAQSPKMPTPPQADYVQTTASGSTTPNFNYRGLYSQLAVPGSTNGALDDLGLRLAASELLVGSADPMEALLGAALQPVDEVLRSQLAIPAGQGLLVASLRADGPSAETGLHKDDILLTLADKPLASADDLTKQLTAAGHSKVQLKILRAGKPLTIQVQPRIRVTLGPVEKKQTEYYIGVSLEPIADALRTQLGLSAGQGVVITDVVKGSPAEKAGVQKNDLALELGGKAVTSPEALAHQVQENRDAPSSLKLLRIGKPMTVPITGMVRKVEASAAGYADKYAVWLDADLKDANRINWLTQQYALIQDQEQNRVKVWELAGSNGALTKQTQRQDQIEKELKALRERMDKILKLLEKSKPE